MTTDRVLIKNIKNIDLLEVEFNFSATNIIVITGKNGVGKTTIIKAFHLIADPKIFEKTSSLNAIRIDSKIEIHVDGFSPFVFEYNKKLKVLDSTDSWQKVNFITAEQTIPNGKRFERYAQVAAYDSQIRDNIAASDYTKADDLIDFLTQIYNPGKFAELQMTKIRKIDFFFLLLDDDYYLREDHFSSGEFFLIQLFRLITSGAKLILIDELDVALDAAAQVRLYAAIKRLLEKYETRIILVSHSLAFMNTVDDGGLYYLENHAKHITLEQRSFGYIKSDLYGFTGYDRYILTEDEVLEGFIEYIIKVHAIVPFYQYKTIGVGGWTQLQKIAEKNDTDKIFTENPENVLCIVDGDVFSAFANKYTGDSEIYESPVDDIEMYIHRNRKDLLPKQPLPTYPESPTEKIASKSYWKFLTKDQKVKVNVLYQLIVDNKKEKTNKFVEKIRVFLTND